MENDREQRPSISRVLRVALASRIGVLLIGFLGVSTIGFPQAAYKISDNRFYNLPARWDTGWYLGIAEDGYEYDRRITNQQSIVFFPAYPTLNRAVSEVLTRLVNLAGGDTTPANLTQLLWIGVAISIAAFCLAITYLAPLAREHLDVGQTETALILMAAYPFAVYFSAHYTEGLFLLTTAAALFHMERGNGVRTAACGFVAGLTRPNGFLLCPVLLVAAWERHWRTPAGTPDYNRLLLLALASTGPVFGALAFSGHVYQLTGDPLFWLRAQAAWGRSGTDLIPFSAVYRHLAEHGLYDFIVNQPLMLLNTVAALFLVIAIVPVTRRLGFAHGAFVAINVLPPLFTGVTSMARFSSVMFPVFFWLGVTIPPRRATDWMTVFAICQGYVAVMFFTWREMF